MAKGIKKYKRAVKLYKVCAVCGVGIGQIGTQLKKIRDKNVILQRVPLFTLQGNFDVKKLHGIYHSASNYGQFKYNKGIFLRSRYKNIRQKNIVAIRCFLLSKIHNSIHNHSLVQIPCAIFERLRKEIFPDFRFEK